MKTNKVIRNVVRFIIVLGFLILFNNSPTEVYGAITSSVIELEKQTYDETSNELVVEVKIKPRCTIF